MNDRKRYNRFSDKMKEIYGERVIKISLNGGFTCPNIDGKKGFGGCVYCSKKGSGDFAGDAKDSILNQFNTIKNKMGEKWKNGFYMPYFQAFTNTYGDTDELIKIYESVLHIDNVIGISIATRSDCIEDDLIDYFESISKTKDLWIELGVQSIHEKTVSKLNRHETLAEIESTIKRLRAKNINVCVHIINSLFNETKEDMIETVKYINTLDIQCIKIHMLHVLKDTALAKIYENGEFKLLTKEEYIDIITDQLAYLDPNILVQRITGDANRDELIAPNWIIKKFEVLNGIDW
ncbi:TIGR01212 family radical SAM protein, partial [bacterium]|nr:TIGR01212 family radical SAM protein [bacterium]